MKINRILLIATLPLCMIACNEDDQFDKELYKKVIYVLSGDDLTFPVNHDLNQEETTGYISINCGGTKHIDTDVTVELEPDDEALAKYNKLNYDLNVAKYAHKLGAEYYDIPNMVTVLKADNENTYSTIPVYVRPEGLSPDSTYLIPLRIKSVSGYEINPDKQTVLYRVLLKNDYATQSPTVYYKTRGTDGTYKSGTEEIEKSSPYTLSRIVVPLTKNSIRCFAGMNTYELSNLTEEAIRKYGMRITVNEDATLTLTAIGSIQIEMLGGGESNYYLETKSTLYNRHAFTLHYRYRLLKDGCDGSNGDADYDIWHEIEETMEATIAI